MSVGDFILKTNGIIDLMTQELALFDEYGVKQTDIDALAAMTNEVQAAVTDEYFVTETGIAIDNRDQIRLILEKYLRRIAAASKVAFGAESRKEKFLSCPLITKLTDSELLMTAGRIHSTAVDELLELQKEGITAEYLEAFSDAVQEFETACNLVEKQRLIRESSTEERIKAQNKLYDSVSKYCTYGKLIFDGVSAAKYNRFILTQTSEGPVAAIENLRTAPLSSLISWDEDPRATSYQLEHSSDGVNFTGIYSGLETSYDFDKPNGKSYYRVSGRNIRGLGEYSSVLEDWSFDILPAPENLQIVLSDTTPLQAVLGWAAVPTASEYIISTSLVNAGESSGAYQQLSKLNSVYQTVNLVSGKRHYFKVSAKNSKQYSAAGAAVYIDVL